MKLRITSVLTVANHHSYETATLIPVTVTVTVFIRKDVVLPRYWDTPSVRLTNVVLRNSPGASASANQGSLCKLETSTFESGCQRLEGRMARYKWPGSTRR